MEVFVVSQCSRFSNVTFPNDSVVSDVLNRFVQHQDISSSDDFYVVSNGRRACLDDPLRHGAIYHLEPRLCGGKGGFGSMLRALGAQIEKTTNREACRDLSGRRLRDVNHEKEMADWLKKQAEREADKEQRRLDRLQRKLAEPKHQFTDTTYQRQCHDLSERLEDSVIKGLQASSGGVVAADKPSTSKRSTTGDRKQPKKKKTKMAACFWTGMDELQSSEEEDESDEESPSTSPGCGAVSVTTRTQSEEAEPEGSSSSPPTSPCSSSPDPVTISPPQEQVPGPPQEEVPSPPQEQVPAPPQEEVPSPPQEQVPGPPQEEVPSPPQEQVPAPPQEEVPGPPQEQVPGPPQEQVPGPPQEQVPGPPQEEVPGPPQEETCIPSESSRDHGVGPTDDPEASKVSQTSVCSSQQQEGRSPPLDLSSLSSVDQLTSLGLDVLKQELTSRGLKCGGTLTERAARLFAVRGLTPDQIDPALLAKPGKAKKK